MGLIGGLRMLWYSTISFAVLYMGLAPILSFLGFEPLFNILQGDIRLLLIITGTILLTAVAAIFVSGYLVLNGWKGETKIPRKLKLLLAVPVGIMILLVGGVLSFIVPLPIVPLILAAFLIWGIFRFASSQIFPPQPPMLDVDTAEQVASKFWKSRNGDDSGPTPLSTMLDGNEWRVTLAGREETQQIDIDARTGIVSGWRKVL